MPRVSKQKKQEAVDLIDVIFPSLDVRFISILDDYDSENPACVQDRVSNSIDAIRTAV